MSFLIRTVSTNNNMLELMAQTIIILELIMALAVNKSYGLHSVINSTLVQGFINLIRKTNNRPFHFLFIFIRRPEPNLYVIVMRKSLVNQGAIPIIIIIIQCAA